jgi:hypothetical protein
MVAGACSGPEGGNYFVSPIAGDGGSSTTGAGGSVSTGMLDLDSGSPPPPALDASGLCGNEIHTVTSKPPTVYFIFDTSGSMVTAVPGGTRYSLLQQAAYTLANDLRYVIRVGAAAFPNLSNGDSCGPGKEIYPPTFGDPFWFNAATQNVEPSGGTPTAATVAALTPSIAAIAGKKFVILTTDGGANCDANADCTLADCTENIEGCAPQDACCAEKENCCAANGPAGPINCLDRAATVNAITALAKAGVKAYIIGIPGSQPYGSLLQQMAFAGGAPMASTPYYYDVQDLTTLAGILKDIVGAEISCDITIADPPTTTGNTNVYLDKQLIYNSATNGWTWSATNVITLNGKACTELRSGEVADVQVVTGCPTQTQ